jgi:F0F1-type ATP synthase assembly protein I
MTDSSSRTSGNQAPSIAAIRAANASLLGKSHPASKAFERDSYATATNAGYGTAMGRGLELAITLLVMVGIGFGVDHLFGTAPLFVVIFSVLGFAGITVKLFLGYDTEMKKHEDGAIWNRKAGSAS